LLLEDEGIAVALPASSSDAIWSERRESCVRNVDAEGSHPITST
jgi:hypothetical protein